MSHRRRQKIATGIYRDKFGIAIVISVQGKPREFRTDIEHGRPLKGHSRPWLVDERKRRQAAAKLSTERQAAKGETFAADVTRYLTTIASPSHVTNATRLLGHWSRAFREHRRDDITEMEVQQHFATFTRFAPSTRNHLRHVLKAFYTTLNGPQGYNPARVLSKVRERYDEARGLPYETIQAVLDALGPSKSKARLMVMAYTGLPQSLIARLQPHDLRLDEPAVYVRPRRKGAGVSGRMLPLSDAGKAALEEFVRLKAFGPFQRRHLTRVWRNGVTWSGVKLPKGVRPYDLRHSFLSEVYRQTGDLNAVSELGMHATLEQTARYARSAVSERAKLAVGKVPRIPERGTTPDPSNSFVYLPPKGPGKRGSNQFKRRPKQADS